MKKSESILVGMFLAVMVPVTMLVLFWWVVSLAHVYHLYRVSRAMLVNGAMMGLGIGVVLTVLYLGNWVKKFYSLDIKLLIPIFLFWSFVTIASFMGLPVGNLILGAAAGLYIGRRLYYQGADEEQGRRSAAAAAKFTAIVTGSLTLFIGVTSMHNPYQVENFERFLGLRSIASSNAGLLALTLGITLIVLLVQYWLTKATVSIAFIFGKAEAKDDRGV